jgi:hypothetical protein
VYKGLRRTPPPGTVQAGTAADPIYLDDAAPRSDTEEEDAATGTAADPIYLDDDAPPPAARTAARLSLRLAL